MNIAANTVVTLSYKLFSAASELIEESPQPITYLHGGHHGIFPKIEAALAQKQAGYTCSVTLEPEDAFGEYDSELVRVEPQDRFPAEVKVGMQFEGYDGKGDDDEDQRVYTVTDVGAPLRKLSDRSPSWPAGTCNGPCAVGTRLVPFCICQPNLKECEPVT